MLFLIKLATCGFLIELNLNFKCVITGRKYTTSIVEKLPPRAANVPTYGYQIASKNGPVRMHKFINILVFRLVASYFPVTRSRICARSSEMTSALTVSS